LIAILEQSSHETREFFDEREDRADPVGVIWEYVDHELSSLEDPRAAGFIAAVGGPVPNDDVVAILREVDQRTREGLTGWVSKAQQAGVVRTDLSAERMASWIMLFINGFADQIGGADDFDAVVEKPLLREVLSGFLNGPPRCRGPSGHSGTGTHSTGATEESRSWLIATTPPPPMKGARACGFLPGLARTTWKPKWRKDSIAAVMNLPAPLEKASSMMIGA